MGGCKGKPLQTLFNFRRCGAERERSGSLAAARYYLPSARVCQSLPGPAACFRSVGAHTRKPQSPLFFPRLKSLSASQSASQPLPLSLILSVLPFSPGFPLQHYRQSVHCQYRKPIPTSSLLLHRETPAPPGLYTLFLLLHKCSHPFSFISSSHDNSEVFSINALFFPFLF